MGGARGCVPYRVRCGRKANKATAEESRGRAWQLGRAGKSKSTSKWKWESWCWWAAVLCCADAVAVADADADAAGGCVLE